MQEKEACQALRQELEDERRRALRMEARVEEQLAEFDTEREQLRSRLKKEEAHRCQLQQQVGTHTFVVQVAIDCTFCILLLPQVISSNVSARAEN